jgi:hypothetical protein
MIDFHPHTFFDGILTKLVYMLWSRNKCSFKKLEQELSENRERFLERRRNGDPDEPDNRTYEIFRKFEEIIKKELMFPKYTK